MINFQSFTGIVTFIQDFWMNSYEPSGCYKLFTLENQEGTIVNFVVEPTTYFVDRITVQEGDWITGFYDANAPTPLIYPPQYRAIIIAPVHPYENIMVDFFDDHLLSKDGNLQLNISPSTDIVLENDQSFNGNLGGKNLIVIYDITTRSIPPITTPIKVIVLC